MLTCLGAGWYPISCLGGTLSQVWGVPHPRLGATPSQVQGGTLSQVWGVPCPRSGGVPHPRSRGVPCPRSWGVLHPRSGGVTPSQVQGGGTPSQVRGLLPGQTWDVVPKPDLGWGTPPARPGMGYPQTDLGWGTTLT